MRKVVCPFCNEAIDIDITNQINECPHCGKMIETNNTLDYTQKYLAEVYKTATQYYEGALSYNESYRYFKEFLRFEPTHLDSILYKFISLLRTSTLKRNVFNEFIEDFNKSEILIEKGTYIRIGHFFEEVIGSTFLYQKRIIDFLDHATPVEQEIALNSLIDLYSFYNFINENISLFTEEEYKDSIFISKDEIALNKEKLFTYIKDSHKFDIDVNNLGSAAIFVNNKKILHSEFDINNYEEVTDFAFFDVMQNGIKQNYVTFIMLIVCTLGVVAGLILGFTLDKTINWIGWAVLAVSAVADVLIFVIFSKKRTKKLATLNKK